MARKDHAGDVLGLVLMAFDSKILKVECQTLLLPAMVEPDL